MVLSHVIDDSLPGRHHINKEASRHRKEKFFERTSASAPELPTGENRLDQSLIQNRDPSGSLLEPVQSGDVESGNEESVQISDLQGLLHIFASPFSIFLLFIPLGLWSASKKWGDEYTFTFNFLALLPLAKLLGDATEELATGLKNDAVAGILNATFGNFVEMMITVSTLRSPDMTAKQSTQIVKTTLLGSILSNVLLVLGMSFCFGGLTHNRPKDPAPDQETVTTLDIKPGESGIICDDDGLVRNVNAAVTEGVKKGYQILRVGRETWSKEAWALATKSGQVLTLQVAKAAASLPKRAISEIDGEKEQKFAMKGVGLNLAMLLFSCLSFALPSLFASAYPTHTERVLAVSRIGAALVASSYVMFLVFQMWTHKHTLEKEEADVQGAGDDGEEDALISIKCAIGLMILVTVVTDRVSDAMCDSIQGLVNATGMPADFLGVILLPIAGNACEHLGAVRFAMVDKPGLAVGIAVGSSTQVALFVVPFAVMVGWLVDVPMSLDFGLINTAVLILSVLIVMTLMMDGRSHWMKGYLLMLAYVFIAVLFWYLPPPAEHV